METSLLALLLALLAILGAIALWADGNRRQAKINLPNGRLLSADSAESHLPRGEMLASRTLNIVGRPDYLIQDGHSIIPIEIKSAVAPTEPYESHQMQLIAYCYLVEENYGIRPEYGIIQYPDAEFRVDYTPEMEQFLLEIVDRMREEMWEDDSYRVHHEPLRCKACGLKEQCTQRLL